MLARKDSEGVGNERVHNEYQGYTAQQPNREALDANTQENPPLQDSKGPPRRGCDEQCTRGAESHYSSTPYTAYTRSVHRMSTPRGAM